MATQIAARIRTRFGIEVSVVELLRRRWTLAELAGEVQRRQLALASRDDLRATAEPDWRTSG